MHYLGAITEQLSHNDPQVALAHGHARQRRDARRDLRQAKTTTERHPWRVSLARRRGPQTIGGEHRRLFDWHGILAHHH